jgi:phosphoribosylamine--glycine ligase
MNILLIGSGGREHALAWKMKQSPLCDQLWIAPGNAGTAAIGQNIPLSPLDFPALGQFVLDHHIGMVVVGPEEPLVKGIFDFFASDEKLQHCKVIGPSASGAQLEGSKVFAKAFMQRHGIPTAQGRVFTRENLYEGFQHIDQLSPPFVLKADGLAGGKGVLILQDPDDAKRELSIMVSEAKSELASRQVLIEEFMPGQECSVFILTDGKDHVLLPVAKDYKRIGDGDEGPNTGGMGAVCPVPFVDEALMEKIKAQVILPTLKGLEKENMVYTGFLYIGLMIHEGQPKVVEYNVRLGDPETQAVLPMLETDLVTLFQSMANRQLGLVPAVLASGAAVTVVAAAKGYPGHYETGKVIHGLEATHPGLVFLAGAKAEDQRILSQGGRVFSVTAKGEHLEDARQKAYDMLQNLWFDGYHYRKDIGLDVMNDLTHN